jgi:hypothetical protein
MTLVGSGVCLLPSTEKQYAGRRIRKSHAATGIWGCWSGLQLQRETRRPAVDKWVKNLVRSWPKLTVAMIALVVAVIALPTFAYAAVTWQNAYPVGLTHVQPSKVTVDIFGTARLNATTA